MKIMIFKISTYSWEIIISKLITIFKFFPNRCYLSAFKNIIMVPILQIDDWANVRLLLSNLGKFTGRITGAIQGPVVLFSDRVSSQCAAGSLSLSVPKMVLF